MIGGLDVTKDTVTSIDGLLAAGEVTASGLHGANRLGSNSLLEGLVFGRRAGLLASEKAGAMPDSFSAIPIHDDGWFPPEQTTVAELDLNDMGNSLSSMMWRSVGIRRKAEALDQAVRQLEFWNRFVSQREFHTTEGWEFQNKLLVARLMAAAAQSRTESRGVHSRTDFPQADPTQARHTTISS